MNNVLDLNQIHSNKSISATFAHLHFAFKRDAFTWSGYRRLMMRLIYIPHQRADSGLCCILIGCQSLGRYVVPVSSLLRVPSSSISKITRNLSSTASHNSRFKITLSTRASGKARRREGGGDSTSWMCSRCTDWIHAWCLSQVLHHSYQSAFFSR